MYADEDDPVSQGCLPALTSPSPTVSQALPPLADIQIPCYMMSKADGMNLRKVLPHRRHCPLSLTSSAVLTSCVEVLEKEPVDVSLVTEMADMYSWGNGNNGQLGLPGARSFKTFMTPQVSGALYLPPT